MILGTNSTSEPALLPSSATYSSPSARKKRSATRPGGGRFWSAAGLPPLLSRALQRQRYIPANTVKAGARLPHSKTSLRDGDERLAMECRDGIVEDVVGIRVVAVFLALFAIVERALPC